jgi:phasin family protein
MNKVLANGAAAHDRIEKAQAEAKKTLAKLMSTSEQAMSLGQGNVEALVKSSHIWAAGVQEISKAYAAMAQAQYDRALSNWTALSGVKSLAEAMELHTSHTMASFEKTLAETGKLAEASLKLTGRTMEPITAHVTLVLEKSKRIAA